MARNNQAVGQTQALQTLNELDRANNPQMQLTRELLSEQISMQAAMIRRKPGKAGYDQQDETRSSILSITVTAVFNLGN
jgi:conjugal transfer/entry exclusion protein